MTLPSELDLSSSDLYQRNPVPSRPSCRFVVVHSGARDGYQLAKALFEAGMLEALVTDLYWPADRKWAQCLSRILPKRLCTLLKQRSEPDLPSSHIRLCAGSGLATLLLDKLPRVPRSLRRGAARHADGTLGRAAGELAKRRGSDLVSYSYYGYAAFTHFAGPGILFQLHPHPLSMRRILKQELDAHPECAASLLQEWELSVPEEDFERLVEETKMAAHILAASSFTRSTLVEHGTPPSDVTVIPYGVDSQRYRPPSQRNTSANATLRLLFVGRINQRKGITYLLDALRMLQGERVQLTVCGRVVDDLELFQSFGSKVTVRASVSSDQLLDAYQNADLFVFPSVAEGFGQVLLESLACGLPILSTTSTAAPDLIEDGVQGFIVEPRRADLIAQRIAWTMNHRSELAEMGTRARTRAEQFSWQRFRSTVVEAVRSRQAIPSEIEYSHV